MKQAKGIQFKIVPCIGIGAFLDNYTIENTGIDGYQYTFILPFVRIMFWTIFLG